jgi:hypothetical protein
MVGCDGDGGSAAGGTGLAQSRTQAPPMGEPVSRIRPDERDPSTVRPTRLAFRSERETVLNGLDRFHLAGDVVHAGPPGKGLKRTDPANAGGSTYASDGSSRRRSVSRAPGSRVHRCRPGALPSSPSGCIPRRAYAASGPSIRTTVLLCENCRFSNSFSSGPRWWSR